LLIREAADSDAGALAALIVELGYQVTASDILGRLPILAEAGEPPLLAEHEGEVAGCLTWHVTPVLHRPGPVGRTTMLIVSERFRGRGVGKALVEAAEQNFRKRGCVLAEVTSNLKRADAHLFYEKLGYERTSYRFGKPLEAPAGDG
jgi:GNAT superfamily N-acetyltransferase